MGKDTNTTNTNTMIAWCITGSGDRIEECVDFGRYDFVLIAPATANTVAKIAHGIADTLVTNAAAQAMKVDVPVYIFPVDQKEGEIITKLPDGRSLKLRIRKEDVANVDKLRRMRGITVLGEVQEIEEVLSVKYRLKDVYLN